MNSRFVRFIFIIIVGVSVTSGCSSRVAKWFQIGHIEGRVVDQDGNPVENARVMLKDRRGEITFDVSDSYEKGNLRSESSDAVNIFWKQLPTVMPLHIDAQI